jgi:hypothetical protein
MYYKNLKRVLETSSGGAVLMVGPPSDVHRQVSAFFVFRDNNQGEDQHGMDFKGWAGLLGFGRRGRFYCGYLVSIKKKVRVLLRGRYGSKSF